MVLDSYQSAKSSERTPTTLVLALLPVPIGPVLLEFIKFKPFSDLTETLRHFLC